VEIAEKLKAARAAALLDAPKTAENLPFLEPLGWTEALRLAVSRLKEKFVVPPDDGSPELFPMAQELAAFLCAYGKLDVEAERQAAEAKAGDRGPLESRGLDAAPVGHGSSWTDSVAA
jgi:hypothetical protein